ncbi:phosphotransferase [Candidatus Gracilibacteria bacterium]|nr:phosphotransferase [Candidatus Gracilibacteria bacterium]
MLEPPDLAEDVLRHCLHRTYSCAITQVEFLPLGVDVRAAVYRAQAEGGDSYFVKLRRGEFNELAVLLPGYLNQSGVAAVIEPLPTSTRQLWTTLGDFTVVLYPFVEGKNAFHRPFTERHWQQFAEALRQLHTVPAQSNCAPRCGARPFHHAGASDLASLGNSSMHAMTTQLLPSGSPF